MPIPLTHPKKNYAHKPKREFQFVILCWLFNTFLNNSNILHMADSICRVKTSTETKNILATHETKNKKNASITQKND